MISEEREQERREGGKEESERRERAGGRDGVGK
jgi:hypothetical protein